MRLILGLLVAALSMPAIAQTLVIGNKGENSVSFVDLVTGREIARGETAEMPHEVAISPDGRRAAVVAYGGQTIDLFDVASATLTERIDLGANRRPHGLVWLADGRLLATTEGSDTLTVVRAAPTGVGPRVTQIPTGQKGSHMVAVSPDGARAFVVNMRSASVSVIDLASRTKVRDVPVGAEPEGVALSNGGRRLWISDRKGNEVHIFDAATLRQIARLPTGATPIRVAISPDGRHAVTSNYGAGTLTFIDTETLKVARTVRVSGNPRFQQVTILFSADGRRLYVAETGIDRIAEVDVAGGKVIGRMPAGRNGDGLGIASVRTTRN